MTAIIVHNLQGLAFVTFLAIARPLWHAIRNRWRKWRFIRAYRRGDEARADEIGRTINW